ncbi:MAG: YcgL domain-containing protein [Rhodanobacter sp.]
MQCFVYASTQKPGNYLWLAARDEFDVVPESLALLLGELRFVLEVQLDAQRRLPLEDNLVVLQHLHDQRWHLQLPPAETLAAASQQPPAGCAP